LNSESMRSSLANRSCMIDRACCSGYQYQGFLIVGGYSYHLGPDKVVNSVDLLLFPSIFRDSVHHLFRTCRVLSERLLDNETVRFALIVVLVELIRQGGELTGRNSELRIVLSGGVLLIESSGHSRNRLDSIHRQSPCLPSSAIPFRGFGTLRLHHRHP
jgi:hypothetical protein